MKPIPDFRPTLAITGAACLSLLAPSAGAQTQSLAFTGGVLLNAGINFRNVGAHASTANPGPETGGAVNRTYDNGYNRVDATGNKDDTTVAYGYLSDSQFEPTSLVLSKGSAQGFESDEVGDSVEPSGNLEYRGSLGSLGKSDWGMLLGFGYQSLGGDASQSATTAADILDDRFRLGDVPSSDFPPAPFAGNATNAVPRLGSIPSRSTRSVPGGRLVSGSWEVDAMLLPITGGFYLETQIAGTLNGSVSGGVLAMYIDSDFEYEETSTVAGLPPLTTAGKDSESTFLFGGFLQLGLDWALWEKASLVASARWQPTQSFSQDAAGGREVEFDFAQAFAIHAGFSIRF